MGIQPALATSIRGGVLPLPEHCREDQGDMVSQFLNWRRRASFPTSDAPLSQLFRDVASIAPALDADNYGASIWDTHGNARRHDLMDSAIKFARGDRSVYHHSPGTPPEMDERLKPPRPPPSALIRACRRASRRRRGAAFRLDARQRGLCAAGVLRGRHCSSSAKAIDRCAPPAMMRDPVTLTECRPETRTATSRRASTGWLMQDRIAEWWTHEA